MVIVGAKLCFAFLGIGFWFLFHKKPWHFGEIPSWDKFFEFGINVLLLSNSDKTKGFLMYYT